jgi:hypothetical protein
MAKLKKEELERVIARDLPGYRVSRQSVVERAAESSEAYESTRGGAAERSRDLADAAGEGGGSDHLSELRRKYLGFAAGDEDEEAGGIAGDAVGSYPDHRNSDDSDDDEEIVAVEPEAANHPWDRSARPKAVVVKGKKVIGVQG